MSIWTVVIITIVHSLLWAKGVLYVPSYVEYPHYFMGITRRVCDTIKGNESHAGNIQF